MAFVKSQLLGNTDFDGFKNLQQSDFPDFRDGQAFVDRVEKVCVFLRDNANQTKILAKRPKTMITPEGIISTSGLGMSMGEITKVREETKKKAAKNQANIMLRDKNGEIIYPIQVNNSLKIKNLGTVDWQNPLYHSEKNIFPIGYISVREHMSVLHPGERCQYLCEILDGGIKPLYKVTPLDDPENSITKDSSTGCWIEICKKLNDIQHTRRSNVTVSGPERFGLSDLHVIKMIQTLPNVEKCVKF